MAIESKERLEKAQVAVKEYEIALKKQADANSNLVDKINKLHNITGVKTVEGSYELIGRAYMAGVHEMET